MTTILDFLRIFENTKTDISLKKCEFLGMSKEQLNLYPCWLKYTSFILDLGISWFSKDLRIVSKIFWANSKIIKNIKIRYYKMLAKLLKGIFRFFFERNTKIREGPKIGHVI